MASRRSKSTELFLFAIGLLSLVIGGIVLALTGTCGKSTTSAVAVGGMRVKNLTRISQVPGA